MEQPNEEFRKDNKPVGYGSSIQSSGLGNRNRPQEQPDKDQLSTPEHDQEIKESRETKLKDR